MAEGGKKARCALFSTGCKALPPRGNSLKLVWRNRVWPLLAAGRIAPVMDSEFELADAAGAHERMESSAHIGKIVLKVA